MVAPACSTEREAVEAAAPRYRQELEDLLQQEHYSVDELAALLEVDSAFLAHAAYFGELPATIVNEQILDISRADVLHWLADPL